MRSQDIVRYWLKSAEIDLEAAESLFKSKKYTHSLFFAHLSLEKLFKACFVKTKEKHAPYTHDLIKLSREAQLALPAELENWLPEISTFNIRTRYLDAKFKFYKKCTPAFTQKQFERIKEIYQWLLKNKKL